MRANLVLHFDGNDLVVGLDLVHDFNTLGHLAEASVLTVKVRGAFAAVTHKELRSARVLARVSHGKDAAIVALVATGGFTLDGPARSAGAGALGAATLNHEIWEHTVEGEPVIEAALGELAEVCDGEWGVGVEELDGHIALGGLDGCC
jgi:hypothetical protein